MNRPGNADPCFKYDVTVEGKSMQGKEEGRGQYLGRSLSKYCVFVLELLLTTACVAGKNSNLNKTYNWIILTKKLQPRRTDKEIFINNFYYHVSPIIIGLFY